MSIGRFFAPAVATLLVMVTAACATSPAATNSGGGAATAAQPTTGDAAENTIRVEVRQNKLDAGTTTVYIEPSAGVRSALGTLDPGQMRVFTFDATNANRNVRLVALDAQGRSVTSQPITVPRGAGLTWDIQVNQVRVKR
jgi:hypothetical protein